MPSSRKIKLRDRVVAKLPERPTTIGDEPADGPDAYYILGGFTSAKLIEALVDIAQLPLDAVITVGVKPHDKTKWSSESTNDVDHFSTLRERVDNAQESAAWKQLVCTAVTISGNSLPVSNQREFNRELFDTVAKKIYHVIDKKKAYDAFYDRCLQISLFSGNAVENQAAAVRRYSHLLHGSNLGSEVSPEERMMAALLEETVQSSGCPAYEPSGHNAPVPDELSSLSCYFDHAVCGLVKRSDVNEDSRTGANLQPKESSGPNKSPSTSLAVETIADLLPISRYQRALAKVPRTSSSGGTARLRAKLKKELANVSGCSVFFVEQVLLQVYVDRFLATVGESVGEKASEWNSIEQLRSEDLTKLMETFSTSCPEIRTRYLPSERVLFLGMFDRSPQNQTENKIESEIQVPTKHSFALFYRLLEENATSPSVDQDAKFGKNAYVYATGDQMVQLRDEYLKLYSSNGAQLQTHKLESTVSGTDRYGRIIHPEGILRWGSEKSSRYGTYLTFALTDGTVVSAHKDAEDRLNVQVSQPSGLSITWHGDGRITQIHPSETMSGDKHTTGNEARRTICLDGTVVRSMIDGSHQILYPNGNSTVISSDGSCVSTGNDGTRVGTDGQNVTIELNPIRIIQEDTPGRDVVVVTREDMVTVTFVDGANVLTEHADGTKIHHHDGGKNGRRIARDGFADVVTSDESSTVVLSASFEMERRNVAGSTEFTLQKRDDVLLKINCNGRVSLHSNEINKVDDRADPDENVYHIDLNADVLTLRDAQHIYSVEQGDIKVDQAPTFTITEEIATLRPTKTTHPIFSSRARPIPGGSPKLFVIREDRSGFRILHDSDASAIYRSLANDTGLNLREEHVANEPAVIAFTATEKSDSDASSDDKSATYRQIVSHFPIADDVRDKICRVLDNYADEPEESSEDSAPFIDSNDTLSNVTDPILRKPHVLHPHLIFNAVAPPPLPATIFVS